jgi:GNAT superfamily N-acetyltransferase
MNKFVNIDYSIIDDILYINLLNVDTEQRGKGIGSKIIKNLEDIARANNCVAMVTPSNLSKIALNFWIKNGFCAIDKDDLKKISFVLNSEAPQEYIFDIDCNSVVELSKKILL